MRKFWCFVLMFLSCAAFAQRSEDFSAVAKSLGRAGKLDNGVYKVTFPRTDLKVHIKATAVEPGAGLGSWMAFRRTGNGKAVADGDLVLTSDEVNPVLSALQTGGLEVSGIHNHLIGEEPQVMYVHFFGKGELGSLAEILKTALAKTKTPTGPSAPPSSQSFAQQKVIEQALGKSGTVNGKVLAFSFPRASAISMHHETLPPGMGMATAINFQSSAQGVAATGDFVLLEKEVNPVIKSLRQDGITVTAAHNHLLDDEPRMVFVHFWAEGTAEKVAAGLRHALDTVDGK